MTYNITNRQNHDVKIIETLQNILEFCEQNGHRPRRRDALYKDYKRVLETLYMRRRNGVEIPDSVRRVFKQVQSYHAYPTYRRTKMLQDKAFMDSQYDKTMAIFPKVGLIYSASFLFDTDTYNRVIMAYHDPVMTKMLADYVDYIFDTACVQYRGRAGDEVKDMILKYIGAGVTDQMRDDFAYLLPTRGHSVILSQYIARMAPGGLHANIIAWMHGLGGRYVLNGVMPRAIKKLLHGHEDDFKKVVDAYINGNRTTMLDAIPENLRAVFWFRYSRKITDVSIADMNVVGRWMLENCRWKHL